MILLRAILFTFCFCTFAQSQDSSLFSYLEAARRLIPNLPRDQQVLAASRLLEHDEILKSTSKLRQIPSFNCTFYPPSPEIPNSVDMLRPGDIRVVAALGDSLTAGFGAKAESIVNIFNQYRGVSWSIGGDEDVMTVTTLPNILRFYNPNIIGYSVGIGSAAEENSNLNRAIPGSKAPDLIPQANLLVEMLKSDQNISYENDWKMVTIWVGSNDLCQVCYDPDGKYSPDEYGKNLREVISILKTVPRVFVNLIQGVNVTQLAEIDLGWCDWLHTYECPCGASSSEEDRTLVVETLKQYNAKLADIADDPAFNTDDFAVVVQPFLTNTHMPRTSTGDPDLAYLAPDCFHFSELSHRAAAVALFNNMFEPVHAKKVHWTPGEPFECPLLDEVIFTNRNSGAQGLKNEICRVVE